MVNSKRLEESLAPLQLEKVFLLVTTVCQSIFNRSILFSLEHSLNSKIITGRETFYLIILNEKEQHCMLSSLLFPCGCFVISELL